MEGTSTPGRTPPGWKPRHYRGSKPRCSIYYHIYLLVLHCMLLRSVLQFTIVENMRIGKTGESEAGLHLGPPRGAEWRIWRVNGLFFKSIRRSSGSCANNPNCALPASLLAPDRDHGISVDLRLPRPPCSPSRSIACLPSRLRIVTSPFVSTSLVYLDPSSSSTTAEFERF